MTSTLHLGDCLKVMRTMADNSVDAVVTDPPYYRVKGEDWDRVGTQSLKTVQPDLFGSGLAA